jgi:hypothetical protein
MPSAPALSRDRERAHDDRFLAIAHLVSVTDTDRRGLLAYSDALLEHVEQLRLQDRAWLPAHLRHQLTWLATSVTNGQAAAVPVQTPAAHGWLLDLQRWLLRGRRPRHRRLLVGARSTETWLELELPAGGPDPERRTLARLTVQRALDRFHLVQRAATLAARQGRLCDAMRSWRQTSAAWANYWRLATELAQRDGP